MIYRQYGKLSALIASSEDELGESAADHFATAVKLDLANRQFSAVVLALGAAQDAFFGALKRRSDIEWDRLDVLHVDTYLGLSSVRPESGASRLRRYLLDDVAPRNFYPILGDHDPIDEEIARYGELLRTLSPSICVVGIGETGHLAFNEPPADFETKELLQVESLDELTRGQIDRAGIFADRSSIPHYGVTMTMPAIARIPRILALVHEAEKATVVAKIVEGPVTPQVPASLLQTSSGTTLFIGPKAATSLSLD